MVKRHIVFLTGAGVSVESGLSTFRGKDGLWTNEEWAYLASTDALYNDTQKCLDFYNWRRKQLAEVEPNEAHRMIAELEKEHEVTVITQNVDNLHERAGSTHVIHLHGELTKIRPENCCNERDNYSERSVIDIGYDEVRLGDKAPNGAQYRPHIVFFGEAVPKLERAIELVSRADIVLIVGTSLQVYPAAGLYRYAPDGSPIYIIDPSDVKVPDPRLHHIREVATVGMEKFIELL